MQIKTELSDERCLPVRGTRREEKGRKPEASPQWSEAPVSTSGAVLFLPARTCTPPNYGKARFAAHLGLNGCPLTAIVPRAKKKHKP